MIVELHRRDRRPGRQTTGLDHFPFVVGRGAVDLQVAEPGVWDRHFSIDRSEGHSFVLLPQTEAPVSVAGEWIKQPRKLRNGDLIDCGAVQFQFRLSPTHPKSLVWREQATWAVLLALLLLQLALAFRTPS